MSDTRFILSLSMLVTWLKFDLIFFIVMQYDTFLLFNKTFLGIYICIPERIKINDENLNWDLRFYGNIKRHLFKQWRDITELLVFTT